MKIKYIYILFILSFIYGNKSEISDSLKKVYYEGKAPVLISTLPFLNKDPLTLFALTSLPLLLKKDTLDTSYPDPNTALLLSSLPLFNIVSSNKIAYLPSLGQIYNKKHLKSFVMTAMKTHWLIEYEKSKDNDIKDRNRSLWWLLILILYGMTDAYVDAHLQHKPNQINAINNQKGIE